MTEYKNLIIAIVITMVVLAIVYWMGKRKATITPTVVPLPTQNGQISQTDAEYVREMAQDLYEDMKGANYNRDIELFREYAGLNDQLFVSVYNDFNTLYEGQGKGTLKEWIEKEWIITGNSMVSFFVGGIFTGSWLQSEDFADLQETILDRMDSLNLE